MTKILLIVLFSILFTGLQVNMTIIQIQLIAPMELPYQDHNIQQAHLDYNIQQVLFLEDR